MFKVVWKSFKYNRKNFLSFFMSEILSVAVIFMLIYIQEALSQVPGIKTEALQFAYQSELRKQLRIIIPCIILIMILVTGYSVKAYINTRIWDYKLFQLLGIRKKNLKVMIGLEYVISGMLACGFGILFGLIGTKIIKEILHTRINARFVKGISMSRVYLVLILSCLIMTIGVYITLQILLDTRTNLGDKIFKIKESRIHSMISVIYFIVGILVISSGYLLVNNDPMMAYMALICILTGLIILMIFGTGFFMEKFSESKYYKKHIGFGGELISSKTVTEGLYKICKKNGLPKISAHGLRHLCATILLEQNVPLEEISHILGHASVSTTFDIYCGEIQGRDNILDFLSSNFDPITHLARKAG